MPTESRWVVLVLIYVCAASQTVAAPPVAPIVHIPSPFEQHILQVGCCAFLAENMLCTACEASMLPVKTGGQAC